MISHVDVFPTLCDLLEIAPPPWLQGRSVMPLVRGEAGEIRDAVFAEVNYHHTYEPQRAVRTPRWKYIRRFQEPVDPVLRTDPGPSRDYWEEHGWSEQTLPLEALYDLVFDPHEVCNRAFDPSCGDVRAELRARLDAWMRETRDPLLDGPIPAPERQVFHEALMKSQRAQQRAQAPAR